MSTEAFLKRCDIIKQESGMLNVFDFERRKIGITPWQAQKCPTLKDQQDILLHLVDLIHDANPAAAPGHRQRTDSIHGTFLVIFQIRGHQTQGQ